jgi:FeS assembly SUF system protein
MFSFFKRAKDDAEEQRAPAADDTAGFDYSALTSPPPEPETAPAPASSVPDISPDPVATLELKPRIIEVIETVFDPEIPVNIYELGLIYDIIVGADRRVLIKMTLTSPNCPSAQSLPGEVRFKVKGIGGVTDAHVEIVWEPPWTMEKMSDTARLQLGLL